MAASVSYFPQPGGPVPRFRPRAKPAKGLPFAGRVNKIYHGRLRRRFAAAGRAGDEDQAAFKAGKSLDDRRQLKLFQIRNLLWDTADRGADRSHLIMKINPVTAVLVLKRGVEFFDPFEFFQFMLADDRRDQRFGFLGGEVPLFDLDQGVVDPQTGRIISGQQKIGTLRLNQLREQVFNVHLLTSPGGYYIIY